MNVEHTCNVCNNTKHEDYELYNRNNPQHLRKFSSICDYCARKKLFQNEWVCMKVNNYRGWFGPFGRAWTALKAGAEFERIWDATGEFGVKANIKTFHKTTGDKYWWQPLPQTDAQIMQLVNREYNAMNGIIDHVKLMEILLAAYKAKRWAENDQSFGTYRIVWNGQFVKVISEKFMKTRYFVDDVEVSPEQLDHFLETRQLSTPFINTRLACVNNLWTLWATFSDDHQHQDGFISQGHVYTPAADSMVGAVHYPSREQASAADVGVRDEAIKPSPDLEPGTNSEPDDLKVALPAQSDISALAALLGVAIDKADGRDYTATLTFKKVDHIAIAEASIEVLGVHVVQQNINLDEIGITTPADLRGEDLAEQIRSHTHKVPGREIEPGVFEAIDVAPGSCSAAIEAVREHNANGAAAAVAELVTRELAEGSVLDVGYDSEFDKVMNAVYDVAQTGQLAELSPDLLRGPEWNRFYAAVKAMRKANFTVGQ